MTINYFDEKLPADVLDYRFDWSRFLPADDSIESAQVTVEGPDSALVASAVVVDGQGVSFWLSGGTAGETYALICRIVTAAGRDVARKGTIPIGNPAD